MKLRIGLAIPPFWRRVTSAGDLANPFRRRDWPLTLRARGVEFRISRINGEEYIYVPALLENLARKELAAYIRENSALAPQNKAWPLYKNFWLAPLFLAPLVLWQSWAFGWRQAPSFLPPPVKWLDLGQLDAVIVGLHGQWHRAITALCLHADNAHFFANMIFGGLFLCLLGRLAGPGKAFLLTVAGGFTGNAISVAVHSLTYRSVGFSTAVFAALGAAAGLMALRANKKIFMPAAAAAALLAMLGTEGAHTDYTAHICGLCAGFFLGLLEGFGLLKSWPAPSQLASGLLGLFILAAGWAAAFWD